MVNLNSTNNTGKANIGILSCRFFYSFFLVCALAMAGFSADPTSSPGKNTLGGSNGRSSKSYKRYRKVIKPVQAEPTVVQTEPQKENSEKANSEPAATPVRVGKPETAKIESFRKKVEVKPEGSDSWHKASSNKILKTQDEIRTGKQSLARVKLADGSKLLLLQNSRAEMEDLSSIQKAIKLLRGRIRAIVTKMTGEGSFKIKTPIGVASVRGTDFEVEFDEDSQEMMVDVKKGAVGVSKLGDLAGEVVVRPGERIRFGLEGEIGDPIKMGAIPINRVDVRAEVVNSQVKDRVVSMAAEESRNSDYQVGKSMVDVDGRRVRIEEYIMRPQANQFKLVVLNERASRFDYFYYKGTFNTALPTDLSIALGQMGGRLTDQPDYYLTAYEMYMSNTHDSIKDEATGGHLVKIEFDGTDYTLTDLAETNTRTIAAATPNGDYYDVYNPLRDTKIEMVSADELEEAKKIAVNDGGTYRNLASGDIYWKTRFNNYNYYINDVLKTSYAPKVEGVNTLAIDYDVSYPSGYEGPTFTLSENPSGSGSLHNRLTLIYGDGTKTVFDNYIIDDEGNVAPSSAFSGLSTSAAYQNELVKWNYQQKVKADEMSDYINLVVDPRIGTMSGLMQ